MTDEHRLTFPRLDDSLDEFVMQTTGYDACWDYVTAAADDPFPRTSSATAKGGVAQYVRTTYEVGWMDDGYWQIGRRAPSGAYTKCCTTTSPLTAPGWDPEALVGHLGLVDWLLKQSAGVAAPDVPLPAAFDELLFAGRLGAVHRRALTPPKKIPQALSGPHVIGRGTVLLPEYPDVPPAGKAAWRLAWLDRTAPQERAAVGDWSPFLAALRAALAPGGRWAELFAACVAAAGYVRRILAGGIGPVFRFTALPPETARR